MIIIRRRRIRNNNSEYNKNHNSSATSRPVDTNEIERLAWSGVGHELALRLSIRPVHLLRVSLLRVLESNFPGDSLSNYTDMNSHPL